MEVEKDGKKVRFNPEDLIWSIESRVKDLEYELEDQKARNAFYSISIIIINIFLLFQTFQLYGILK